MAASLATKMSKLMFRGMDKMRHRAFGIDTAYVEITPAPQ
jgi:hypothetical protein